MRYTYGIAAALCATTVLLAGCSSDDDSKSGSASTTCGEYLQMNDEQKTDAATAVLKNRGNDNPAGLEVTGTRTGIRLYCETVGGTDDSIDDFDKAPASSG